jgi:flagellar protein FliO/FliZ
MDTVFIALRVLVSLAAVVGLLWFLQKRITKGTKSTRASKLVTVVTRQGLAQKASVVVIDVEGKRFLLGVTEHSVTVLDSNELPPVESFATVLASTEAPKAKTVLAPIPFPQQFDPRTGQPKRGSSLDGSLLSAETWKRAAKAIRQAR